MPTIGGPSGSVNGVVDIYYATSGQTVFTLSNTPKANELVWVFRNGVAEAEGATEDYTLSGKTLTLNRAANANDKIVVRYMI